MKNREPSDEAARGRRLVQVQHASRRRTTDDARWINIDGRDGRLSARRTDRKRSHRRPGAQISSAIRRPDAPEVRAQAKPAGVPDTRWNDDVGPGYRAAMENEVLGEIGTRRHLKFVRLDAGRISHPGPFKATKEPVVEARAIGRSDQRWRARGDVAARVSVEGDLRHEPFIGCAATRRVAGR